jgi:hypothetical protein
MHVKISDRRGGNISGTDDDRVELPRITGKHEQIEIATSTGCFALFERPEAT